MVLVTLTLTVDLYSTCCHTKYAWSVGMSNINEWCAADTHTQTHTEGENNSQANPYGARLKKNRYSYKTRIFAHFKFNSTYKYSGGKYDDNLFFV